MIQSIVQIWEAGGWVMIPLCLLAVMMFWVGIRLWLHLRKRQFRKLGESQWKLWVRHPDQGEGEVGEMIRYAVSEVHTSDDIVNRFAEIRAALLPAYQRQMSMLGTFVAAAPLVGLLGTVFGMLVTFKILASGGGGDITQDLAQGIKQALYPPQVGLCISLPGLILARFIKRQLVELDAFLAQLESYTVQFMRSRTGAPFVPPVADDTMFFKKPDSSVTHDSVSDSVSHIEALTPSPA
jgi:biopolymer transport protein ExbB